MLSNRRHLVITLIACVVVAIVTNRLSRPGTPSISTSLNEDALGHASISSSGTRSASLEPPASSRLVVDDTHRNRAKADTIIRTIRVKSAFAARTIGQLGIEGQANSLDGYLSGMIATIREIEPQVIGQLAEEFSRDICKGSTTDLDVVIFSKIVLLEPAIGSARAFGCALERRKTEDVVLWSLLDAWDVAGREPLPSISRIEKAAVDDRTRRRLVSPSERRAELTQQLSSHDKRDR
jgi:hypothetical protein